MQKKSKKAVTRGLAVALAAGIAFTAALPVHTAEAGHRGKKIGGAELVAAGIVGLAVGAIIADATRPKVVYQSQPVYVPPQPVYRQPLDSYSPYHGTHYRGGHDGYRGGKHGRRHQEPTVIRYDDGYGSRGHHGGLTYEPWTPEWQSWCSSSYRSFNPRTGTFRGYDGRDHFCVVK